MLASFQRSNPDGEYHGRLSSEDRSSIKELPLPRSSAPSMTTKAADPMSNEPHNQSKGSRRGDSQDARIDVKGCTHSHADLVCSRLMDIQDTHRASNLPERQWGPSQDSDFMHVGRKIVQCTN
eukprot:scaffold248000_cov44-Prasinocladus_malaysianus.AAC.1